MGLLIIIGPVVPYEIRHPLSPRNMLDNTGSTCIYILQGGTIHTHMNKQFHELVSQIIIQQFYPNTQIYKLVACVVLN